jgi:hypothetical protein
LSGGTKHLGDKARVRRETLPKSQVRREVSRNVETSGIVSNIGIVPYSQSDTTIDKLLLEQLKAVV